MSQPTAYNRRAIMRAAWAIVRRLQRLGQKGLRVLLSRALKSVWWDAKRKAALAKHAAARRAAELELITRGADSLRQEITILENRTTLRSTGLDRLRELRHALARATEQAAVIA